MIRIFQCQVVSRFSNRGLKYFNPSKISVISSDIVRKSSSVSEAAIEEPSSRQLNHEPSKELTRISEVPIKEVLKAKHTVRWVEPVLSHDLNVKDAIVTCIDRGLSGMMVVNRGELTSDSTRGEKGKVVGLITSRDLLRILASGLKEGVKSDNDVLNEKVGEFMTPISQVIYAKPEETIGQCRTIMAKLGLKCLPILNNGRVEGLITSRDMSDFGLDARDRGGKRNFLLDISERKGLSSDTSMAEPPTYLKHDIALAHKPLNVTTGKIELPHPFKTKDGFARKPGVDMKDYANDPELSEDSYFNVSLHSQPCTVYMGVADGVGSWREYGVDPRNFSHRLMQECHNIILESSKETLNHSFPSRRGSSSSSITVHPTTNMIPTDILSQAYERVKEDKIIGSSTACVAMFDGIRHQLHFSNIGDSGVIVLRHIDSSVAGALKRDRTTPRSERNSDLRVAFVSQQQLRTFNHPYQLGFTGENIEDSPTFKLPADSCSSSIHIRRGDIIILATDGLFDNVDIDDISNVALEWEKNHGFLQEYHSPSLKSSNQAIPELAQTLCHLARKNSLDNSFDSPFAILAKENDIMWSGGMPDDCTVIAMHVVSDET